MVQFKPPHVIQAAWNIIRYYARKALSTGAIPANSRIDMSTNNEVLPGVPDALRQHAAIGAVQSNRNETSNEATDTSTVITLQLRPLDGILCHGVAGPATIEQRVSYPQETVEIPPLRIGTEILARVPIRENERHMSWRETAYPSQTAAVYAIENALVHGAAGLIGISDAIVTETTWHTEPSRHRYEIGEGGLILGIDQMTSLSGTYLSLLTPGGNSYWHAVIDGVARLATIPDAVLATVDTVLFSSDAIGQRELLALTGLPESTSLRPVKPAETFYVERLLLPWNLHGVFNYHPIINRFFDAVLANHKSDEHNQIERLYVDRRGAAQRRLLNEEAVVTALVELGFVAVRLEDLPIATQINLFRKATIIVAPHGAGLTNIGFASSNCIVIELMMDAYVNWCFRRIAAIRKISYDCVIGTTLLPWAKLDPGFHSSTWHISVEDVIQTVQRAVKAYAQK